MRWIVAVVLIGLWGPVNAGSLEGRVIEVQDGRTLTVLATEGSSIHRVRLAGLSVLPREQTQGSTARESLRRLTRGKTVRVETTGLDSGGVLVGSVLVLRTTQDCAGQPCSPEDPGLALLSSGFASVDKASLAQHSAETQRLYLTAQEHARTSKLGVWRRPTPTAFRQ